MYFPLEINEQLANAMRAAAELKVTISSFSYKEKNIVPLRVDISRVEELDEILCNVINRIAEITGDVLADDALAESKKRITDNPNNDIDFIDDLII